MDLTQAYQVSLPGKYSVAFRGLLPDVVTETELKTRVDGGDSELEEAHVETPPKKFTVKKGRYGRATKGETARQLCEERSAQLRELAAEEARETPRPPNLSGGTKGQKTKVKKAYRDGYDLTVTALSGLRNDSKYKEWFGSHTANRFAEVKRVFQAVRDEMENTTFTYHLTVGTECEPGDYAYTYVGATEVWLCGGFWKATPVGTNSQAGTVLHEQSHASAGTVDIKYGQSDCRKLARNRPRKAVKNADNYEYYAGG